jgi:hypothetical protein
MVGLDILLRCDGGTRGELILLKPIGRDRQAVEVRLLLQGIQKLNLLLIRQTTWITHLLYISGRKSSGR